MRNKVGIALGGGGARGAYQIGVLKALEEEKLLKQVKHISGTSIGAINTLMIMAKLPYERMIEIWQRISNKDIYGLVPDRMKLDRLGLYSLQDLFETLSKEVSLSEIRKSRIQGYATATKLKKDSLLEQVMIHRMEREVFHLNETKDPHKAVLASASIPVLFGSTTIGDNHYVDGGIVDNCPVQPLLEVGCNIIFVVPIDGHFHPQKYEKESSFLVNLETKHLFHMVPYDILDFKPDAVTSKADYGYKMTKLMIKKLRDQGYLTRMNYWKVPKSHYMVEIDKEEEIRLKDEVKNIWT